MCASWTCPRPIAQSPPEWPEVLRTDIDFCDHAEGAAMIESLLGVPAGCCATARAGRSRRSRASAPTTPRTSTRPGTTTRASAASRPRRSTSCRSTGSSVRGVVLDMTAKEDGETIDVADVEAELGAHRPRARGARHRAGPHRPRRVRTTSRATWRSARASRAEATRWLYERGVRVMGIDAWGWDAPLHLQASRPPSSETSPACSGRPTRRTCPTRRSSAS